MCDSSRFIVQWQCCCALKVILTVKGSSRCLTLQIFELANIHAILPKL